MSQQRSWLAEQWRSIEYTQQRQRWRPSIDLDIRRGHGPGRFRLRPCLLLRAQQPTPQSAGQQEVEEQRVRHEQDWNVEWSNEQRQRLEVGRQMCVLGCEPTRPLSHPVWPERSPSSAQRCSRLGRLGHGLTCLVDGLLVHVPESLTVFVCFDDVWVSGGERHERHER